MMGSGAFFHINNRSSSMMKLVAVFIFLVVVYFPNAQCQLGQYQNAGLGGIGRPGYHVPLTVGGRYGHHMAFKVGGFTGLDLQPGIQMRLTKKGMEYGMRVAIARVKRELLKIILDHSGKQGPAEYTLSKSHIDHVRFPHVGLRPISSAGVEASLKKISMSGAGHLQYSVNTGLFNIKINGEIGFSIKLNSVSAVVQVEFGKDAKGRPMIKLQKCSANIGSFDISFNGGGLLGWIMNLFRGLIGNIAKGILNPILCKQLREQAVTKAEESLKGFPVMLEVDNVIAIDYQLTTKPVYTNDYMDIYLRGQFKCLNKPCTSHLVPKSIPVSSDSDKMMYLWVTNYALDTAGEAFHSSGILALTIEDWKIKLPDSRIAEILQTSTFVKMIPNLTGLGNFPVALYARSYKAPRIIIKSTGVHMQAFAEANFKMKQGNKISPLFGCKVYVLAVIQPQVTGTTLSGRIVDFDFKITITSSITGNLNLTPPPEMKELIMRIINSIVNPVLQKGFPLPKTKEVAFTSTDFRLYDGSIRVGTDLLLNI